MADFGQGGTRTVNSFSPDVTVNATRGQHLVYQLTVRGGRPAFTFTCIHRSPIASADQFAGHPQANYQWKLFKTIAAPGPTDFTADSLPRDVFGMGMSFLGAIQYSLKIELRDNSGNNIQTVQDIVYQSQFAQDIVTESLGVTWS